MKLKTLTPKHLRLFDEQYQALEEVEGKWKNYERAFISAVRAGWFVEDDINSKSKRDDIIAFIDEMDLGEYTELCQEVNKIYLTGKQTDLPAKDPN